MEGFQERRFAWGSQEWVTCEVAQLPRSAELWVVFRDSPAPTARGVLTSAIEHIANLFSIELMLKRNTLPVKFFHISPLKQYGRVPRVDEVRMSRREGQFHYASWTPAESEVAPLLTAAGLLPRPVASTSP